MNAPARSTSAFRIRVACVEDLPAIAAIGKLIENLHSECAPDSFASTPDFDAFNANWRERIAGPDRRGWVAEVTGPDGAPRIVGIATARLGSRRDARQTAPSIYAYIDSIGVYGTHRRKGIGAALLLQVEDWATRNGAAHIRLDVAEFNAEALRLYEHAGFATRSRSMDKPLQRPFVPIHDEYNERHPRKDSRDQA